MASYTPEQVKEIRAYDNSLNREQKDWVAHKCNWEHMTRLAVLTQYRGHIDSLAAQPPQEDTPNE